MQNSDTQFMAWHSSVTEREAGWGNRPDGHLLAIDKEKFFKRAEEIKASGSYAEYSSVDSAPVLRAVTEEIYRKLETEGSLWVYGRDWYVKN